MAALPTRAYVQQSGDYYLCPLSGVQVSAATLQQLVAPVQANPSVRLRSRILRAQLCFDLAADFLERSLRLGLAIDDAEHDRAPFAEFDHVAVVATFRRWDGDCDDWPGPAALVSR